MRNILQTYVVQTWNPNRYVEATGKRGMWEDRREWIFGLLQVEHLMQKRDAIRKAKRIHGELAKRNFDVLMRVVRRHSNKLHDSSEGWTVGVVWQSTDAPRNIEASKADEDALCGPAPWGNTEASKLAYAQRQGYQTWDDYADHLRSVHG